MVDWLKPTISPSEIIFVLVGERPIGWNEAARRGMERHRMILNDVVTGRMVPRELKDLHMRSPLKKEITFKKSLDCGLILGSRIDLMSPDTVVDLKPGQIKMRQVLQVAYGCMASGLTDGAVYLYEKKQVYQLQGGGFEMWGHLSLMAAIARRILDIDTIFKEKRPTGKVADNLGKESFLIRGQLDNVNEIVTDYFKRRTVRLN